MMNRERFALLCEQEASREEGMGESIGTYAEKRLHRILKRWITEDEGCFEVPIGQSVADVLTEEGIFEIQTGSLRPLLPKLLRYLETTDFPITVIVPLFAMRRVIRMDRDTGEILRTRRVYTGGRALDGIVELYPIAEVLADPRVRVIFVRIEADEYRYSERMRYRREGAYDSELFPRSLTEVFILNTPEDYRVFLPDSDFFYAADYGAWSKLKRRDLYSALNLFCKLGLLRREAEGRKYRYYKT